MRNDREGDTEYRDALSVVRTLCVGGVAPRPLEPHDLEFARRHRVVPFVQDAVDTGRVAASSELRAQLASVTARTILLQRAAVDVGQAIAAEAAVHNCPLLVFKGWWVADVAYETTAHRPFTDVDMIIGPGWADTTGEAVELLGGQKARIVDLLEHNGFGGATSVGSRNIQVDLHRHPLGLKLPIPSEWPETWPVHTKPGVGQFSGLRVPSPELALAQAAVNYAKDRYAFIGQLLDIVRLAADPELDWAAFEGLIEHLGVSEIAHGGLHVAHRELVGIDTARRWRDPLWLRPWTRSDVVLRGRLPGFVWSLALDLHVKGQRSDALRLIARQLVPDPEVLDQLVGVDAGRRWSLRHLGAVTRFQRQRLRG